METITDVAKDFNGEIFQLVDFNRPTLVQWLANFSQTDASVVDAKSHIDYFESYFYNRKVKKMLIEYPYIDKDYLEDYSAYYARSFKDYKKWTLRLHFFADEDLSETLLQQLIRKETSLSTEKKFTDAYLGYIVVKPISATMIGKTVLQTYPENDEGRNFPINRQYHASICGIDFHLDSIGYQEQDKSVAACATSALWSVFQSTSHLFHHAVPSPAEITRLATRNSNYIDRTFPSSGLSIEQMATCIKAVGLEPEYQSVNNYQMLKAFINAYQHAKIPTLLGTSLYSTSKEKFVGDHAMAVMGFSKGNRKLTNFFGLGYKEDRLFLSSSRIDKIFVHDDQIGPFARMEFDDPLYQQVKHKELSGAVTHFASLASSWKDKEGGADTFRVVPNNLLVPLYHKIRIPFDQVLHITQELNFAINDAVEDKVSQLVPEWDILLDTNTHFKREVLTASGLTGAECEWILKKSLPKYIWRIQGKDEDLKFEFLVDATDIAEGDLYLDFIIYDKVFAADMYAFFEEGLDPSWVKSQRNKHFLEQMLEKIKALIQASAGDVKNTKPDDILS